MFSIQKHHFRSSLSTTPSRAQKRRKTKRPSTAKVWGGRASFSRSFRGKQPRSRRSPPRDSPPGRNPHWSGSRPGGLQRRTRPLLLVGCVVFRPPLPAARERKRLLCFRSGPCRARSWRRRRRQGGAKIGKRESDLKEAVPVHTDMGVLLRRWRILFPGLTNGVGLCQKQKQCCRFYHEKQKRLLLSQHFLSMNLREDSVISQESKMGEMTCKSQKLMLLGGLIYPTSPGCYHYMPYTVRAMEKLIKVIDQGMQYIGGQKVNMPALCSAKLWRASGRWEVMSKELFRLADRHGQEYCLGPTHEETITDLIGSQGCLSYKQLPLLLYQVTRKFRDEPKPRFGLLRGREFYMKDMYTFDASEEAAHHTYALVCNAYCNIFDRLGLRFVKVQAATGSIGGTMSHEFQLPADIGEDQLMTCTNCDFSANAEMINLGQTGCPVCKGELVETKGIEVGHTFFLGTKYSSVFNATVHTSKGELAPAEMGCYGLGVTRILAASIEVLSTEEAIRWPSLIAPYQVCLIPPKKGSKEEKGAELLEDLYDCVAEAIPHLRDEIVLDDRIHLTIGKRLKDANKLGYPYVIIGGKKALDDPSLFEVWDQNTGEALYLTKEAIIDLLSNVPKC